MRGNTPLTMVSGVWFARTGWRLRLDACGVCGGGGLSAKKDYLELDDGDKAVPAKAQPRRCIPSRKGR
jgi:hypothetical protein